MNAAAPMWVRVGGGMESIPDHRRHGPADPDFPPPGGPWKPLNLGGRLVGWADDGGLGLARRCAELGELMVDQHRDYLLGRLGHKLRSAVLALQESARRHKDTVGGFWWAHAIRRELRLDPGVLA